MTRVATLHTLHTASATPAMEKARLSCRCCKAHRLRVSGLLWTNRRTRGDGLPAPSHVLLRSASPTASAIVVHPRDRTPHDSARRSSVAFQLAGFRLRGESDRSLASAAAERA